jgi:hypothetical protein
MNCRWVEQLLSDDLEGLLTGKEADNVSAHLRNCPACRRFRNEMISLEEDVRETVRWQPGPFPDLRARAFDRWSTAREVPIAHRHPWFLLPLLIPATRQALLGAVTLAALAAILCLVRWPNSKSSVIPEPQIVRRPAPVHAMPAPHRVQQPVTDAPTRRIATSNLALQGTSSRKGPHSPSPGVHDRSQAPAPPFPIIRDPLIRVNHDPEAVIQPWVPLPQDEQDAIEERVRRAVRVRDDFVRIPFPQIAATSDRQIAEAVQSYEREAAIVDPRLAREVTLQQKATALSDLCEELRADTGIQLRAGPSVADEKVTLFCKKMPLREVMRQLSRPFGYTWLRSGKAEEYKYELVQDLRSQLLEEELRNRDRNTALLALERDIEQYRPFLNLSPDEALARSKTAQPAEKKLLENLAGVGWGPIHVYHRLSRQDLEALRAGQGLIFSQDLCPGDRPLPPELGRGVLQSLRMYRAIKSGDGWAFTLDLTDPRGVPLTAVPELRGELMLAMPQSELGQFALTGQSGYKMPGTNRGLFQGAIEPFAIGRSPSVLQPENGITNAKLAYDPALRPRVTLQPQPSCRSTAPPQPTGVSLGAGEGSLPEPKATSADVLEVLHRATGMALVADYYTHLYKPGTVSVRSLPLFEALNHLADAMHLRWKKEESWLQFRSTSYFNDRLKEVPNRLLARWAAARRQCGFLTLDDLIEIAQLPDAQLNAHEMAEGGRLCFGLAEWDLTRHNLRPQLRYLAQFTPAQREEAMSSGLPFTKMSLAQQQQFLVVALGSSEPLQSLEELKGATLRVEYTQPGWFQWGHPDDWGTTFRWAVPLESGAEGRRIVRPVVHERTREAALAALRRVDAPIRERIYLLLRREDPRLEVTPPTDETQIFPTQLDLAVAYIPSDTNARAIHVVTPHSDTFNSYQ